MVARAPRSSFGLQATVIASPTSAGVLGMMRTTRAPRSSNSASGTPAMIETKRIEPLAKVLRMSSAMSSNTCGLTASTTMPRISRKSARPACTWTPLPLAASSLRTSASGSTMWMPAEVASDVRQRVASAPPIRPPPMMMIGSFMGYG